MGLGKQMVIDQWSMPNIPYSMFKVKCSMFNVQC